MARTPHTPKDPAFKCPKCGKTAKARSSEQVTQLAKKIYYQCTNIQCAHTWRASLNFDGTINPGMIDDSKLPPHRRLKQLSPEEIFNGT